MVLAVSMSAALENVDPITCKIDFTIAVLGAYERNINNTNFSLLISNLTKDKNMLIEQATTGNASKIREFVKNNVDTDLKSARIGVDSHRSLKHGGLKKEQKQALKDEYKKVHDIFKTCQQNGMKNLGEKRVEAYTKILEQHTALTDKFEAKGLNASGMRKVISDANAQVIVPLKDAIAKANSSDELHSTIKKYCLFNGCKNGVNFHFAAKFEIERLSATLAHIKSKEINISDEQVMKVQNMINSMKGLIVDTGTAQYAEDGKMIRGNIRGAYDDLKKIKVKKTQSVDVSRGKNLKEERLNEQRN